VNAFVRLFSAVVLGVLSGYDRLVFRGTLRKLCYPLGLQHFLYAHRVPFKDFATFSQQTTERLIDASLAQARQLGREIRYLNSSQISKEEVARAIARRDQITQGLVCVLTAVEPSMTFCVRGNRATRRLELRYQPRPCLHLYHYHLHPRFGWMHARLQTWFPFRVYVCLNGREWLARQMDQAGLAYRRRDNSFTYLQDPDQAQRLCDEQLRLNWPAALEAIRRDLHPAHEAIVARAPAAYYWSVHQSEWATDVLVRSRAALEAIYPRFVRHGVTAYGAADVLRFLGRQIPASGQVPVRFNGTVETDCRQRPEGVRLKHRLNGNSLKLYDKGSVLRVETTINQPADFRVYRPKEGEPDGPKDWRALRDGVADLHRRAEVSQKANERYLEALAAVKHATPLRQLAEPLCRPARRPGRSGAVGRRVRALNPLAAADAALLTAVSRPEFLQNGLRNRDVRRLLYPAATADPAEQKRRSAAVTRQLALLRGHGVLHKVPKTHRYVVSPAGRLAITALLAARNASAEQLTAIPA